MDNRIVLIISASLFVLLLLISGCGTDAKTITGKAVAVEKQKPVVNIGAVLPLSGSSAFIGEGASDALVLAKEMLGETKYNYRILLEDDQLNPKVTSTAANKLISVDGVDAIMSITSGTGNVVTPLATQHDVIHFGIASDENIAKGKYNFIHWTTPDEEARKWAEEAERRGIKKVGVFLMNQQGAIAINDKMKEELEMRGIEVYEEVFGLGTRDFKTIIMKLRQHDPDVYLMQTLSPELEILTKQTRELGIDTPLSGIECFEYTEQMGLFEGQWYVQAADPTDEFSRAFEQRFGEAYSIGSPNAYDVFNLLVTAYEKAGDGKSVPDTDDVIAELKKIDMFDGALGELEVDSKGIVHSEAVVRMIEDGRPVTIG